MPPDSVEPDISCTTMKEAYAAVLQGVIDDITLELCFKVHRALKLSYFPIDEYIVEDGQLILHNGAEADPNYNYFSSSTNSKKSNQQIICPHCKRKVGASRFAPHLHSCMNDGGRVNKERSAKRTSQMYESEEENDYDDYSDSGKKKKRKPAKNPRRAFKAKLKTSDKNAVGENSSKYGSAFEQTNVDLTQKCGVLSIKQKTMCQNTLNCRIHTDDQKREVRRSFLKSEPDPNVHIDVDTVDVVSRSPSPSEFSLDSNNSSVLSIKMEDVCSTPEQPRLTPSYP